MTQGQWSQQHSVFGLPKIKQTRMKIRKAAAKEKEEAATPTTAATPPPASP